eukprot:CAMPEP_0171068128 /NCGR_PEP_ID=MMETSP0766_2-20121228/8389_1 /TAXON_ID=439317 /ORGANISM="Gambierdiscus australes, Strain CAWD 149" /LENGTH=147 /DNA_ID=CAMNT_0011524413 /DNA_START=48 /DNA_END=491 /DNA_ORIENTATION=+
MGIALALHSVILLVVLGLAAGVRSKVSATDSSAKWWPFTSAADLPVLQESKTSHTRVQDLKDAVMMSAAFGHKTAALCHDAANEERARCRQVAGERLFCALLQRHEDRYRDMEGAAEAKAKCTSVDIMENSLEAARDEQLQEEAKQA